ncbi:MAG: DUF454 family protein [Verrucomicrobia bacterium]|nr:DUF454 family protein [Verrucomicrobiota bacterium]
MILKTIHKTAWLAGGVVFFLLFLIGLLLPVIPQLPFFIVSIFCFIRCSPRFNDWMSRKRWFKRFHGWAEQRHWFKHVKEHLPKPKWKNKNPS